MTTKPFTIRSILSSEAERQEKIIEMEARDFEVVKTFNFPDDQSAFLQNGKYGPKYTGIGVRMKYGVLFRKVGGY